MYSLLFPFIKKTSLNVPVARSLYIHIHDCFRGKGPSNRSMVVCFGSIRVRIHGQAVYLQREGNPEEEWGVGWGVMTTKRAALCGQLELNPQLAAGSQGGKHGGLIPREAQARGDPELVPAGDWLLPGGIHHPVLPGSTRAGKRALQSRESPGREMQMPCGKSGPVP